MPISGYRGQQSIEDINNKDKHEGEEKCDKTLNLQNNFLRARVHSFLMYTQNSVKPFRVTIHVDEECTWHRLEVNEWLKIHPVFTKLKGVIWGILAA